MKLRTIRDRAPILFKIIDEVRCDNGNEIKNDLLEG